MPNRAIHRPVEEPFDTGFGASEDDADGMQGTKKEWRENETFKGRQKSRVSCIAYCIAIILACSFPLAACPSLIGYLGIASQQTMRAVTCHSTQCIEAVTVKTEAPSLLKTESTSHHPVGHSLFSFCPAFKRRHIYSDKQR